LIRSEPLATGQINALLGGIVGTDPDNISSPDDVSVMIPGGAFWDDIKVTVSRIDNLPSSAPFIASDIISAYEFGPSNNLEFSQPVTITIPYYVTELGDEMVFWYNTRSDMYSQAGISNIEHIIISDQLHALRYTTTHFTPYVVAQSSEDDTHSGGSGAGGGCSMSPYGADSGDIIGFCLPYIVLFLILLAMKFRRLNHVTQSNHIDGAIQERD